MAHTGATKKHIDSVDAPGPFDEVTVHEDKNYNEATIVNGGVIRFVIPDDKVCRIKLNINFEDDAQGGGTIKIGS